MTITYNRTNWQNNKRLYEDKLNNLEQRLAQATKDIFMPSKG